MIECPLSYVIQFYIQTGNLCYCLFAHKDAHKIKGDFIQFFRFRRFYLRLCQFRFPCFRCICLHPHCHRHIWVHHGIRRLGEAFPYLRPFPLDALLYLCKKFLIGKVDFLFPVSPDARSLSITPDPKM